MKKKILAAVLAVVLLLPLLAAGPSASAKTEKKLVALTFDDGPGPYTERLLDGLAAKGARATFFTLGQRAEAYPGVIRRILTEGHQLANHSYSHPELTALGVQGALNQIGTTNRILNGAVGGQENYFLRAPYGSLDSGIRSQLSCPEIYWSVDTLDWMYLDADHLRSTLLNQCSDGAIVLMHDIHSTSVNGVLSALDSLKAKGFEFVTVRELFRRRGVSMKNGVTYYSCSAGGKDLGAAQAPQIKTEGTDGGVKVTLSSPSAGAGIYYTLNGAAVGYGSRTYTEPFVVTGPCTIRAAAVYHLNGDRSLETTFRCELPPAHAAEAVLESGMLTLSGVPEDETLLVSLDGGVPTEPYTGPIALSSGSCISFYTKASGKASTPVQTLYYTARGNLFADVGPKNWYLDAMDQAASLDIFHGTGHFQMAPNSPLTRGMFMTLLYNLEGTPVLEEQPHTFADVQESAYYAQAVEWAYSSGIAAGVSKKGQAMKFEPNRAVTRQEMAQFLLAYYRFKNGPPAEDTVPAPVFADGSKVSGWAREAVEQAGRLGLMTGDKQGNFSPLAPAVRAQGASVLCKLHQRITDSGW